MTKRPILTMLPEINSAGMLNPMRFHGLMLVRDEADILPQTIEHLLSWLDGLYVLDMGSTDSTWDIVQAYARRDSRVVPLMSRPILFSDSLRSFVFDQVRDRFTPGDWVVRVDGDEFYHVLPPQFVAERVRPWESAVHLQWYYFRLTRQEVDDYESGRVSVQEDRLRPIEERRRHYKLSTYPEPRMFRYRRSMRWPSNVNGPYNAGFVARERIPIRHYPHRDPVQMERRFRLRAAMIRLNAAAGGHWKLSDWRMELVDEAGASNAARSGAGSGLAGEDGIDTGPLLYWKPGTPLPEVPLHNHLPRWPTRVAQRIAHSPLLPLLDRRRPGFDPAFSPTDLPTDVVAELQSAERTPSQPTAEHSVQP